MGEVHWDIARGYASLAYDGELTFVGVLQRCFIDRSGPLGENIGISERWNDNTREAFLRDYENRIIPAIVNLFGSEKPMHAYAEEDFESILDMLQAKNHYQDSTLSHYRYLLWCVYKAGVDRKYYEDNIFWGEVVDLEEGDAVKKEKRCADVMTRVRKSFSIQEELKILEWFKKLSPESATGEELGLLLMFFEGVRNNEACGANYASIHMLSGYPDTPIFDIVQSTKTGGNEIKAGGKTSNAPRVLPLFIPLFDVLIARKEFIQKKIEEGEIRLPIGIKGVDQLPIVCVGHDYAVRASTRDLTTAGRTFFEMIGISKSEIAVMFQILCTQEFKSLQLDEKEPTTYLFRRNCATHLYQTGLSSAEIQYWIGHEIEDAVLNRNAFADEDSIFEIAKKMKNHPFTYLFRHRANDIIINKDTLVYQGAATESESITIDVDGERATYIIHLDACEAKSDLDVSIRCAERSIFGTANVREQRTQYSQTALITNEMKEAYQKHSSKAKSGEQYNDKRGAENGE